MTTEVSTPTDEHNAVTGPQVVTPEQPTYVSPREAAMASIDDQVTRQMQELGVYPGEGQTPAEAPSVPAQAVDQGERMLTVKVGGVEKQLPESEVVKGYQKDSYADQRLREAADRLKEVEERERQLELQQQSIPPETTIETPPTADAVALATQIVNGIVEGNVDAAVETLAQALSSSQNGNSTPVMDEAKIAEIIEKRNRDREYELDKQKANRIFNEEYGDIAEDEDKFNSAVAFYSEEVAKGKMPSEAAKAAGDRMRKMLGSPPPPPTDPLKERQERKQSIDTITPAHGVNQSSLQVEAQSDPRSVIAEMKQQRGQT